MSKYLIVVILTAFVLGITNAPDWKVFEEAVQEDVVNADKAFSNSVEGGGE